jgi:hypothetical protein
MRAKIRMASESPALDPVVFLGIYNP